MAENSQRTARGRGPGRPFQAGQSGNPGGRPLQAVHVRDLARERTEEAIRTLTTVMSRGKTEQARVRAAEALLNRGWGQPTQPVEQTGIQRVEICYVDDWRSTSDEDARPSKATGRR